MLDSLLHESFYTQGTVALPDLGCYVGWVAHKESYSDCNPISNPTRDVLLIFSGEHFDGQPVDGRPQRDDRTAAEILRGYETKGEAFIADLNGWFAGVLIDCRTRRVVLFNDRYGVHRVYYTETKDAFIFSSEAKAILAICPETRALDDVALGEFLVFSNTLGDRTLFSNVHQLPNASAWTFSGGASPSKSFYFTPSTWENLPTSSPEAFYEDLRATVSRIVPQYFRARTNAAVSLTGGLDTRIVMGARPVMDELTPCYTYGGYYRDCYDVHAAAEVAAACGQPHQVLPLGRDFFDNFATHAERTVYLTDGCQDITGSHELYFSQKARQISPIRITGNYGSEVLRSVSTFKGAVPSSDVFTPEILQHARNAKTTLSKLRASNEVTFSAMQDIPWHLYGRLAVAQSQLVLRSPYMDNRLVSVAYTAPPALRKTSELSLRLIGDLSPALHKISTDMGLVGSGSQLLSYPRRLHRYATFKAEWYYNLGMPEWLGPCDRPVLKKLAPLFLGWHKIDHFRVWFRDQLSDYLRSMLSSSDLASRPYLKPGTSRRLLQTETITGQFVHQVSVLLTLELIQKTLIRPKPRKQEAVVANGDVARPWSV